jgi:hypothetical protein
MAMSRSFGCKFVDAVAGNADLAFRDLFEAGDHPEQGGLAAAGRADEHDELAVLDLQLDVLQDLARGRRTS